MHFVMQTLGSQKCAHASYCTLLELSWIAQALISHPPALANCCGEGQHCAGHMATTQNALLLARKHEHGVAACRRSPTDPELRAQQFLIWLSSKRANWWLVFYWCRRVECINVVIMIIMSNDSVWLMCCCWWHICYHSLLAILRKKVGKPKEEIRNLYGFHMNSSNKWIHMYKFIHMKSFVLWIHLIQIYFLHCP